MPGSCDKQARTTQYVQKFYLIQEIVFGFLSERRYTKNGSYRIVLDGTYNTLRTVQRDIRHEKNKKNNNYRIIYFWFIISLKRLFFISNPNEFHFFINIPSEVKNSSKKRENVSKNVPEIVVAIAPILTIDTRIDISSLSWSYSSPDEVSRAVCVCEREYMCLCLY